MTRVLVTGASGLLGLNFCLTSYREYEVIGVVNRNVLNGAPFAVIRADLSQPGAVERMLDQTAPEVVLHCAAMANVDECERQPERASYLNAAVPGLLGQAASRRGIQLVHVSTDAVFDGVRGNYSETDMPHPINQYARTKLVGEQAVLQADPQALVVRVNFYGWSLRGQRSLAEWFYNNLSAGRPVNGFTDVYFCPLHVNDLGMLLRQMIERRLSGIYHVVSSESLSKYDFGLRIARKFGLQETLITPTSWKDGRLTAVRSPNLTLKTDKLANALGVSLPGQEAGLQRFHAEFGSIRRLILELGEGNPQSGSGRML